VRKLILLGIFYCFCNHALAQATSCPPNIDFEQGNFGNWQCFTGTAPGNNLKASVPITNRHTIVSGTGTDPIGGFPIVAPGGGTYSVKLGNNLAGSQSERIRYKINIPIGFNNYSLLYNYAVVFEDPGHAANQQPRFKVEAFDSATNNVIFCMPQPYVAGAGLPGFFQANGAWYQPWVVRTLNLSGLSGKTVYVQFTTADCTLSGHYGYAYIDLQCGIFQIANNYCPGSTFATLTAPPGYQSYIWKDSSMLNTVGSGLSINLPAPTDTTFFYVILNPFSGYGCSDTLKTLFAPALPPISQFNYPDSACAGAPVTFTDSSYGQTNGSIITQWNWLFGDASSGAADSSNLQNPNHTYSTPGTYTIQLIVKTNINCVSDTVFHNIVITSINNVIASTFQNVSCYNGSNAIVTVSPPNGGAPPYSYSWNSSPIQLNDTAYNLPIGTYTLTVTDALGCAVRDSTTVLQAPPITNAFISNIAGINCFGAHTGAATVTVPIGGVTPYTYTWNTTPIQNTNTITQVPAGTYTVVISDANACSLSLSTVITQPDSAYFNLVTTILNNVSCFGGNDGAATVATPSGNAPFTYNWSSIPVQNTATAANLTAGNYTITVVDATGCIQKSAAVILQPLPLQSSVAAIKNALCYESTDGAINMNATFGGIAPYTYSWNTNPINNNLNILNLAAGTYTLTIQDANGCSISNSYTVTQPDQLNVQLSSVPDPCRNNPNGKAFANHFKGGIPPYHYYWTTQPPVEDSSISKVAAGYYSFTLSDSIGCRIEQAVKIDAAPALVAIADRDTVINLGNSFTIYSDRSLGTNINTQYAWYGSNGSLLNQQTTLTVSPLYNDYYVLKISNDTVCPSYDTAFIKVVKCGVLLIPNAFTPNQDGIDDVFKIINTDDIDPVIHFSIFNHWGQQVYYSENKMEGWDGTFNGKEQEMGTYIYIVEFNCIYNRQKVRYSSDVTLIR